MEEGSRGSAHVELVVRGYVDLRVRAEGERLRAGREERGRNSNKGVEMRRRMHQGEIATEVTSLGL